MPLFSSTKCETCAQYMKNSLILFFISTCSAAIISSSYFLLHFFFLLSLLWSLGKTVARLLSSLGQIFCAVLPLFETEHLLLTRSTIALSILSLQIPKGFPNVENSSESSIVVPLLASSIPLQFLVPMS